MTDLTRERRIEKILPHCTTISQLWERSPAKWNRCKLVMILGGVLDLILLTAIVLPRLLIVNILERFARAVVRARVSESYDSCWNEPLIQSSSSRPTLVRPSSNPRPLIQPSSNLLQSFMSPRGHACECTLFSVVSWSRFWLDHVRNLWIHYLRLRKYSSVLKSSTQEPKNVRTQRMWVFFADRKFP